MSVVRSSDSQGSTDDPFLAAHAADDDDDEPYTESQRATAEEGLEEYLRGETVPWEEFRRELLGHDAPESS